MGVKTDDEEMTYHRLTVKCSGSLLGGEETGCRTLEQALEPHCRTDLFMYCNYVSHDKILFVWQLHESRDFSACVENSSIKKTRILGGCIQSYGLLKVAIRGSVPDVIMGRGPGCEEH